MARPIKDGLDYFPKDTGFYRNRKIRALIGRFGSDGAVLYDYILCEVYGDNGFYTEIDDSFVDIAAADLRISPEKIGLILDYLLNKSMLLDGTLFKAVKVLTSHGIQTRYQQAVRQRAAKRGVFVDGKLWLLDEAETESFIQVRHKDNLSEKNHNKSEKNHCFSVEKSLKESKGKESKGNENIPPFIPPEGGWGFGPELSKAVEEWLSYKKEKRQAYKPVGQNSLITQIRNKAKEHGEKAVAALIMECMANNWQGIIWNKLNKTISPQQPQKKSWAEIARELEEKKNDL